MVGHPTWLVSNIIGSKAGAAAHINEIESHVHLTHCHSYAQREGGFNRLGEDTAPGNSGNRILCSNSWTI